MESPQEASDDEDVGMLLDDEDSGTLSPRTVVLPDDNTANSCGLLNAPVSPKVQSDAATGKAQSAPLADCDEGRIPQGHHDEYNRTMLLAAERMHCAITIVSLTAVCAVAVAVQGTVARIHLLGAAALVVFSAFSPDDTATAKTGDAG